MQLSYVGDGAHIPGVPARDLTDDDVAAVAAAWGMTTPDAAALLVERGLYAKPKSAPRKPPTKPDTSKPDTAAETPDADEEE